MTFKPGTTHYSSREFNQDTGGAKRAAEKGAVYITDRGRPSHVLLAIDEYRRLTDTAGSIVDQLAMPDDVADDFELVRVDVGLKAADLD